MKQLMNTQKPQHHSPRHLQDEGSRRPDETSTRRRSTRLRRGIRTHSHPSQALPRMASSTPRRTTPAPRQYMFIEQDVDRSTSSEAIRVHVMRESHRARRHLRGLMQSNQSHGEITIFPTASPTIPARSRTGRETGGESGDRSPQRDHDDPQSRSRSASQPNVTTAVDLQRLADERRTSVLSNTSPAILAASPSVAVLERLPRSIIDMCGRDSAALHALLALITSIQNSVGLLQAAEYESSALEILRSRLAEAGQGSEHSDETILTVLLLSRLERARNNEETAGFHEAALQRMVQARGGFSALATSNGTLVALLQDFGLGEADA